MRCSKKQQTSPKPGLQPLTIQAFSLCDFFARSVTETDFKRYTLRAGPAPSTAPSIHSTVHNANPHAPAYAPANGPAYGPAYSPAYGKPPLTSPSAYSSGNPQPPAYAPQLAASVDSSGI